MKLIPVYDRNTLHGWAQVDDADYDRLIVHLWKLNKGAYAYRYTGTGGSVAMHREVLGLVPGDGLDADHINGNGLDNRSENLRAITRQQNISNRQAGNRGSTSKYRGVSFCKSTGRWIASVTIDRQMHWLGRHDTEEQAAKVAADFRAAHMPFSADARDTKVLVSEGQEAA